MMSGMSIMALIKTNTVADVVIKINGNPPFKL
jgi:hypothetical protein